MRALVAGAAGFLGSHLCDRLVAEGYEVTGVDSLHTGNPNNLRKLESNPAFEFLQHDITRPIEAATLGHLDLVFNLACPASPPQYQRDPIFTLDTNYLGTKNLLELGREEGQDTAGLHERGVRRPGGQPAGRVVLG